MPAAPKNIDDITPAWLTDALRENGFLEAGNTVVSYERKIIGEGTGYASRMARYALTLAQPSSLAPASLVIKIEPETEQQQAVMNEFHTFEREIRFYREIAPTAPLRLPRIYFTYAESPRFAIGMEDLSHFTPGDQLIGMPYDQVERVVTALAKLQAMYWQNDHLDTLDWMPTENNFERAFDDSHWQGFCRVLGKTVSTEGIAAGERFRHHIHWIEEQINAAPKTLVHYDLREDNMLFGQPGTADEFIIVDWQVTVRGCGAYDVARLMAGSETPAQREGHQLEILRTWHDALLAHGVTGYSFEDALYHFKLCLMSYCSIPVFFHEFLDLVGGERNPKLLAAMAQRGFAAVVELNATDILPQ
ncbi:MAG: oxidoreductase family protein [Verrucomicrobiota bacterium]